MGVLDWARKHRVRPTGSTASNARPEPATLPLDPDELYISEAVGIEPCGSEFAVVHAGGGKPLRVLPTQLAFVLGQLGEFRTLSGHAEKLRRAGWQEGGGSVVDSAFRELRAQGLLHGRREVLAGAAANGSPPPTSRHIESVSWITCGRPAALERSVASFQAHFRQYGHAPRLLVCDDSVDPALGEQTRTALHTLADNQGFSLAYLGPEEKRKFAQLLLEAGKADGLSPEVVEFTLFNPEGVGSPIGANRNAALLATVGELTLQADDDSFCELVRPFDPKSGLELFSRFNPALHHFYPDRKTLLEAVQRHETDLLAAHESLLGHVPSQCLTAINAEQLEVSSASPRLASMVRGGQGHVRATTAGVFGDSGMGSPRIVLGLNGEMRERLMVSEQEYLSATISREILRIVEIPTLCEGVHLPGFNLGLDNAALLPPFFPVQRNEDIMFGFFLRICDPTTLIGHIPVGVAHAPVEDRTFQHSEIFGTQPSISELLMRLLAEQSIGGANQQTKERMQAVGAYLNELGNAHPDDLEDRLRMEWSKHLGRFLGHLEHQLYEYDFSPKYWADDIERYMEKLRSASIAPILCWPRDVPEGMTPEEGRELFQRLLRRYGALLGWWPAMRRHAVNLRERESSWTTTLGK